MNSSVIMTLVIVGVGAGIIILSIFFNNKQRLLRNLKKTKAIPVNRAQENQYVKLIGKAKHVSEPLNAPLSGRPCVFYQILVERKGSKNSWHTVIKEIVADDFFIEAGDEMAIVKMKDSQPVRMVYLVKDHNEHSATFNDANETVEAYLKNHGKSSVGFLGLNKTMRYKEGIIEIDETIAVKGVANWKRLSEPIAGYPYSKILTLSGTKKQKLVVTDLPKATQENKAVR